MVWSGSATHPSNCTRVWCSKYPQKHPPDFPCEAEVRRSGPHHKKTELFQGLRQVQKQDQSSLIFFLTAEFPTPFAGLLHFGHLQRPTQHGTSAATLPLQVLSELPTSENQRRHERNWSFTRDILRNQEEHRRACLLRTLSTLLYLLQKKKTPRLLLSFPLSHSGGPWGGSRHTLLLSSLCTISTPFPIQTPKHFVISSILRFPTAYPPNFEHPHLTASALPVFSPGSVLLLSML